MKIAGLAGIFTGSGFVERDGRRPSFEDCGFVTGPVDIRIDGEAGIVAQIGSDLEALAGEEVLDATGLVALPGFVDPHTHALFGGDRSSEFFQRWSGRSYREIAAAGGGIRRTVEATISLPDESLLAQLRRRLRAMAAGGTTLVEIKSGYSDSADGELRLLRLLRTVRGEPGLPEVTPTFLGLHALPDGWTESRWVDAVTRILPIVAVAGLALAVDVFPEKGFFSLESTLRFSEAARALGLLVKAHADEMSDLGSAAAFSRIRALSVDHLQWISPEGIAVLADSATVATVLPATSFFLGLPYAGARRLIDAGANVALGTDFNPGTAPVADVQFTNLLAASQLGMTAPEILCASTFNAACALGLGASHGALVPGRVASLQLYQAGIANCASRGNSWLEWAMLNRKRPVGVIIRGHILERLPS